MRQCSQLPPRNGTEISRSNFMSNPSPVKWVDILDLSQQSSNTLKATLWWHPQAGFLQPQSLRIPRLQPEWLGKVSLKNHFPKLKQTHSKNLALTSLPAISNYTLQGSELLTGLPESWTGSVMHWESCEGWGLHSFKKWEKLPHFLNRSKLGE